MHTISLRSMTLLAAVEVGLLSAQNTVPTFDQYRVMEPKFSGKPMLPVIKTAEDRRFQTMIREAAADGPNFAGNFTVAEWGCGAGCVSVAIIDAATGSIYRGPFRVLSWEMRKYEGKYAANDDKFQQLEYRLDSRLLVGRGCPEEANCASYFGSGRARSSNSSARFDPSCCRNSRRHTGRSPGPFSHRRLVGLNGVGGAGTSFCRLIIRWPACTKLSGSASAIVASRRTIP